MAKEKCALQGCVQVESCEHQDSGFSPHLLGTQGSRFWTHPFWSQLQLGPANIFHNSYFLPLLSWNSLLMERIQFRCDCLLPELGVEISTMPFHSYFVSLSLPCWLNVSSFLCSLPKEVNSLLQLQPISSVAQSSAAQ